MSCRKCTAHIATFRWSDTGHDLGHVGEEALQRSGADGRPDQPFDDGGVLGIEGMQVRIGTSISFERGRSSTCQRRR